MGLFNSHLDRIRQFLTDRDNEGILRVLRDREEVAYPSGNTSNVVLSQDTAVELGHPREESTSFLIWLDEPDLITDRRITLVGPDLPESHGSSIPFGKIVMVGGNGFTPENSYDRYREMEVLRFDLNLKGYMMRGVSQYCREWSRVSTWAIDNGLGFATLGGALIEKMHELDYVKSVEIAFITSSSENVRELSSITVDVMRIINAMNKMFNEMSFDCDTCEYTDVCDDISELRSMRDTLQN
jgi:CO dehydrogenase/acetyl-CoA synthase beta subunit